MARTPDLAHKHDLLDEVTEYVRSNGVSDLSLRPLAQAVGTSPRNLLYHFGSSAEMVKAIVENSLRIDRENFEAVLEEMDAETPTEVILGVWKYLNANRAAMRLYVDLGSLGQHALNDLEYLTKELSSPWRLAIASSLIRAKMRAEEAYEFAELSVVTLWGALVAFAPGPDDKDTAQDGKGTDPTLIIARLISIVENTIASYRKTS